MNTEELIAAVEAAELAFNNAVADARAAGLVIDLFVASTGPAATGPSLVQAEVRSE